MSRIILPFQKQRRLPGFDPTHPAAVNARLSVIAVPGGGYLALNNPSIQVTQTVGAPTFSLDGYLGPSYSYTGNQDFRFGNQPVFNETSVTIAAAINPTTFASVNGYLQNTINGTNAGWALRSNSTTGALMCTQINVNDIIATIALTAGVPQLAIASASQAAGKCNFLILRLDTGAIKTSTTTFATTAATGPPGNYQLGQDNFAASANGKIGPAMFSGTYLSIPQLMQWAASWGSYWYPQTLDLSTMLTAPPTVTLVGRQQLVMM